MLCCNEDAHGYASVNTVQHSHGGLLLASGGNDHAVNVYTNDGTLAVAYQGAGGETLWLYQGNDFFTGAEEIIDDGVRTGRINLVGSSAALAFDSLGTPYVAYADQTEKDHQALLDAIKSGRVLAQEGV